MKNKTIIISIKPEYAEKIFKGDKTVELRKGMPNAKKGDRVIIYVTYPIKAVKGIGIIQELIVEAPNVIWKLYSTKTGISEECFFTYYSNKNKAIGIILCDVFKFENEFKLVDIKKIAPDFTPPQTFKYASNIEIFRKFLLMNIYL